MRYSHDSGRPLVVVRNVQNIIRRCPSVLTRARYSLCDLMVAVRKMDEITKLIQSQTSFVREQPKLNT
jgi:hypothetical protein